MSWREELGFYEHIPLTKEDVQRRYEELVQIRRGDAYAVSKLNDAWKKAQEECVSGR